MSIQNYIGPCRIHCVRKGPTYDFRTTMHDFYQPPCWTHSVRSLVFFMKIMDVEKLIYLVQQKECLWNRKNYYYYNRQVHRRTWEEVAKKLDYSVEDVQKKWKHIRDTFRREYKKVTTYRPGEEDYIPKWPFYNSVLFVKGLTPPAGWTTSIPSKVEREVKSVDESSTTTEDDRGTALENQQPSTSWSSFKPPLKNNHKNSKKLSNFDNKRQQVEEDNIVKLNRNVVDSEMSFLMSLYPSLKQIPFSRQLIVRYNIMQALICKEASNPNSILK